MAGLSTRCDKSLMLSVRSLLNYCGLGPDFLDFTVERNPYKHVRYTSGMHIPIKPVKAIDAVCPG